MNQDDIKALQVPLLAAAIALLLGAGAVYYSGLLVDQARQKLAQAQSQRNEARGKLQRSGDEKSTIEKYLPDYQRLAQSGFIGNERRINWLDGLRTANQRADLFGVDYQIEAQQGYPFAAELDPGTLAVRHSVMTLRFRLLHEEDLMRFFNVLAQTQAGIFSLNQCTLQRIDTGGVIRVEPHLNADCELSWITTQPTPLTNPTSPERPS